MLCQSVHDSLRRRIRLTEQSWLYRVHLHRGHLVRVSCFSLYCSDYADVRSQPSKLLDLAR